MTARRVIVLLGLIVLGAVAARDLDVRYEPDLTMPEVHVRLALPASLSLQPGDVARRWAVPVEAAIRAVGGTEAIAGSVSTTGLELTARFSSGTDVETKTARIQSELEPFRRSLPEDSFLDVSAATFESATYLALTGELQSTRVREIERSIERLPSVRSVRSYGSRPVEMSIEVASSAGLEEGLIRRIEGEVADIGRVNRLGETRLGGRRIPVYIEGAHTLEDVAIDMGTGLTTLDSLAAIRKRNGKRTSGGRYDGQPAVVLGLQRDPDVPLLRFDRELRASLDSIRASLPAASSIEVLQSEADPLRRLLRRLGVGLAFAIAVLAMAGWMSGGRPGLWAGLLGVPTALSLALHAIRFTGLPLDATTIPVLATGLVLPGVLLLLPNRSRLTGGWGLLLVFCGLALPIAVAFAAGPFTTILIAPAKVFAVAMSSVAACLLLFPPIESSMRPGIVSRRLRSVLRGAPTVLLVAATLCYSLLTMFGKGLDPRKGSVVPDRGRIFVTASLPEGTTLEQAEDGAARLEEKIGLVDGVDLVWGRVTPERVLLVVEVAPDRQSEEGIDELSSEIRYRAGLPFGHVIVRPGSSGSSGGIRSLEIEPEANDDGLYNLVIEGDEVGEIESAVASIESIAFGVNWLIRVTPEWGTRSVRVELRPMGPNAEIRTRELATAIADRVSPPRGRALGVDEVAIVRSVGMTGEWVAPSRAEVLDAPLHGSTGAPVPSAFLEAQEEVVAPRVSRQRGRFAVRVLIEKSGTWDPDHWLSVRKEVDQRLSGLTFDGAEMKRPEIRPLRFSDDAVRLIGMASVIPGMILLIAVIWANSLWRFFPFVLPPALAVTAAAPTSRVAATGIDELSLLMLAGVCLAVLAVSLASGERIIRSGRVVGDGYRVVVATAIPMAGAALACGAVLIGSTLGTDAARDPWILGSRISGVAALVALPSALLLPVSALYALEAIRRRRMPEVKARRRPAEWTEAGKISLDVRHVSKAYRGGFRALRDVSFRLEPGVIGLLGPNGAGKTTLLRILTGLLQPSRGQVHYRGHPVNPANIDAYREHIGFLPQSFNAYPGFTAEEFVDFWVLEAGINDPKQREEEVDLLITAVGLEEHKRRKVRDFSGGMRQRIGIARALIARPDLLVVDEPTTGLDIEGRSRFRGLMLSVAAHRVVILSTHIAGDVEATCSRVLLLHRGQLRFDGAPEDLIAKAEGRVFEMTVDDHDVREISHRFRLTKRVRVMDGIRVKGVVPTGETLPGPATVPGLEEAYLAEIDLADVAVGRKAKFTFLFGEE